MDDKNTTIVDDKEEIVDGEVLDTAGDPKGDEEEYEKVCFVCRRPESKTGKMITMQPNLHICPDCMQKTFDVMKNSGFDFDGAMNGKSNGMPDMSKMPNISMINLADLQNMVPKRQKVKKKKPQEETAKKAFDIKSIPAPHKIKAKLDDYVVGQ